MLSSSDLRDKLSEFCDTQYTAFGGFPPTKAAARKAWAGAFADYLSTVEEKLPLVAPNTHASFAITSVSTSFEGALGLAPQSAAAAAADFAGAWKSAIASITAAGTATDTTGSTYAFIAFTNVATQGTALEGKLKGLFAAPANVAQPRLAAIADAFHDATTGLLFSATMTAGGVSSPTTVGLR